MDSILSWWPQLILAYSILWVIPAFFSRAYRILAVALFSVVFAGILSIIIILPLNGWKDILNANSEDLKKIKKE